MPDMIITYLQMVAGAADIPITRLLGTSPKGFNATGAHEIETYNQMLVSIEVPEAKPVQLPKK